MARILLLDLDERVRRALRGILNRGGHRLVVANTTTEAWDLIQRNLGVDLVFTEITLGDANGLTLVQRLKDHRILRLLPVVIYTERGDRATVKRAIELRVQNFLIKPYYEDDVFAAVDKAQAAAWRHRLFEDEKSFCKLMDLTPEALHQQFDRLEHDLSQARIHLQRAADLRRPSEIANLVHPLKESTAACGAWGVADCLDQLVTHSSAGQWEAMENDLDLLDFAGRLIRARLNPVQASLDFLDEAAREAEIYRLESARWLAAPARQACPVVPWIQLQQAVAGLRGCPVIESSVASFQLQATGLKSSINPLMDLVARDPGLSMQMLVSANRRYAAAEDYNRIEDARLAASQLGELALQAEARGLLTVTEGAFNQPPHFSWARFWTFQRGVARIARLICRDLGYHSLEPAAGTAGQLHGIGKLIIAHLHPAGFQAILQHARLEKLSLRDTERLFLGGSAAEIAGAFAEQNGLSRRLVHALRWIDAPADAPADRVLVAILSLARSLCQHNQVGTSGEPVGGHPPPLEETPEWEILREGLYPSFNLRQFELKVHAYCAQIRTELSGHKSGATVGALTTAHSAAPV